LVDQGYTNIQAMEEGFSAWERNGYPIDK